LNDKRKEKIMAQCVTCGASLPPGSTRCLKCGTVADVVAPPAQQTTPSTPQQPQVIYVQQQPQPQVQVSHSTKSKGTAAVLAILLGGLGAHTFVPEALGIIEGIIYLTMSDTTFAQKYNK
jgi:predicted ATP-dependent serine protease